MIVPNLYSSIQTGTNKYTLVFRSSTEGDYVYTYTTEVYDNQKWNSTSSNSFEFDYSLYTKNPTPIIRYNVQTNAYSNKVLNMSISITPLAHVDNKEIRIPSVITLTRGDQQINPLPTESGENGNKIFDFILTTKESGVGTTSYEIATLNLQLLEQDVNNALSGRYTSTITLTVGAE